MISQKTRQILLIIGIALFLFGIIALTFALLPPQVLVERTVLPPTLLTPPGGLP